MKKLLIALAFILSLPTLAQKEKEEEIVYYTDSDVKHNKFYIGATYSPYYVNRRILSEAIGTDQKTNFLNQGTKGSYGYSIGGDLYYKLNPNFHISVGVNKSAATYSIDFKKVADDIWGIGDTISGNWRGDSEIEYINIPFQVVFSYAIGDYWDAEVIPSLELNMGTKLIRTLEVPDGDGYLEITDPSDPYWGDRSDDMRDVNYTVGLGLGGNYYITPKFSFVIRAHVKYMLRPIISESPGENLLWLGGQTGIRLYF